MADLKGQQLKDRYQTLLTTSATTANPTTGTLQNGDGSNITELSIGGSLGVTGGANLATSSGNVGIGTATPVGRLNIAGNLGSVVGAGNSVIRLTNTDTGNFVSIGAGIVGENNAGIDFSVDGNRRMVVTSAGNVGIGTASPTQKLHVAGVGSAICFDTTGAPGSSIIQTVSDFELSLKNNRGTSSEIKVGNENLEFSTNSTERMRITSAGNVGIGTASPATKLDVSGAIRASTGILFGTDTAAANTLDDYEEGTWTPGLGGTWSVNPTALGGQYVKIGGSVWLRITWIGGSKTSATSAHFTGVPFQVAGNATAAVSDVNVDNKGLALVDTLERIFLTANSFTATNSATFVYQTTD